ncbi:reverse transcriptase domain-containing protein [Tanacetum coccineum]
MDKVNIQDFCEEHYDDILPIIMDKVCRDKRKEVHARLDFEESPEKGQRAREGSQNSSAGVSLVRYHTPSRRPRVQDRLRYNDGNVFNRLSCRRRSVHERLSDTYSPSMTRSKPSRTSSRDPSRIRGRSSSRDHSRHRDHLRDIEESYDGARGDGGKANLHHPADLKVAPVTRAIGSQEIKGARRWRKTWSYLGAAGISGRPLKGAARVWFDELPPESINSYKDLKAAFLAYFMQQKKHVKNPVEMHNIKQRDGETIEEFMEHFKVETGRMKGAPECMKIFGFMHGVNNHELTKRLNERVPKTLEEMMTTTTAFIRGETAAMSKKKFHTPWKPHDQTKRHTSERRSDFRNQPRDGRGSNNFTPLNRMPK